MQAGFDDAAQVHHMISGVHVELVGPLQFGMLSKRSPHVGGNVRISRAATLAAGLGRAVVSTCAQRARQKKAAIKTADRRDPCSSDRGRGCPPLKFVIVLVFKKPATRVGGPASALIATAAAGTTESSECMLVS